MDYFIFQSIPERYDLRRELVPGRTDTWYATRYRNEMDPGDPVFFWMAGDENFRGLYGWGVITSRPYMRPEWKSHGVDVEYEVKFERPILARRIKSDSTLRDFLIFKAPQASNFLLEPHQAHRLIRLIRDQGERPPEDLR